MIKLIPFLLIFTVGHAAVISFEFPDQKSLFESYLSKHLKHSHQQITILTPSLDYPSLRKELIRKVSHGSLLILTVQSTAKDPLALVAYEGISLFAYQARDLYDTTILIDKTVACHLPGPLTDKHLSNDAHSAWCTDDTNLIEATGRRLHRLTRHSKPYLE